MRKAVFVVCAVCWFSVSLAAAAELPKRTLADEIAKLDAGPADGDFSFVVMGDTRDGDAMFKYMIELANRMNPAFILDVGDLVHSGATDEQYLNYLKHIATSRAPFFSVIGNHENMAPGGLDRFKAIFGEPDFYFDYGGARFIGLDNSAAGYKITDAQFEWLEKLLQTDKIKFVFMHAPPKTHVWDFAMDAEDSDRFMQMMEKYKVRKVYFGHVHAFDRLRRGETDYVMTGCAGAEPDPVSFLHHRKSGGYYHFMLVQVRGGKVMDVLIEPSTADINEFPNKEGVAIETPYVTYRHFKAPVIRRVDVGAAAGNADIPVTVEAGHNPDSLETGLSRVTVECEDESGKTTGPVSLASDTFDERIWTGSLPGGVSGSLRCSVAALDGVGATTMSLPAVAKRHYNSEGVIALKDVPLKSVTVDPADPTVDDELDILGVSMAHDDKYIYLRMDLNAPPKDGDRNNRVFNLVGIGLLDEKLEIVPNAKKMLSAVPLIVYAPLAVTMGLPECAVFDMSNFEQKQFNPTKKGVNCKVEGASIYFRAEKSLLNLEDTKGALLLAASGKLMLSGKVDARITDAAPMTLIKFGDFKGDPAAPWPSENVNRGAHDSKY